MSKNIEHLQHIKSNVVIEGKPKLPTAEVLVDGELAVNYAEGYETISLRNSNSGITTFSSDDYYTKNKLGSGFTGVNSANTVTSVIEENEEIISSALNDLDERKLDASAYTPTDLSNYYTKSQTSGASELEEAFSGKADSDYVEEIELVTAAALNDLEGRKLDVSAYTEGMTDYYLKSETSGVTELDAAFSGKVDVTWVEDKIGSAFTGANSGVTITEYIEENEETTAAALNDLNERKMDASAYTPTDLTNYYTKSETSGATEISNALGGKVNSQTFISHTADTDAHVTSEEKTLWNAKADKSWVEEKLGSGFTSDNSANTITYDGFSEITLTCETQGADIYYRLNNTGEYSAYTTAITITADTIIQTYSELNGQESRTVSQTCQYVSNVPIEYSNRDLKKWNYGNQEITTPYSVNAIDGHSSNYAKGTFNFETSFALSGAQPTYLWFQHADHSASIYVDDALVEKHWGGYAAFTTDISEYVHSGTNNIKVAIKNNEGNYVAPAAGDFNFNATLGNVRLLTSPYLPAMNYGYDGFHITSTVSNEEATININTSVPTGATLICKIDDGNTNIYSATSASTSDEMTFTKVIANPHLWNGKSDPYLYTVTLEIYGGNELYHRFVRPYGLRYYEYVINDTEKVGTAESPYTGFLLNGSPYLLRGCCMHDDIEGRANALTETDYDNTFATIQELGLNFLRLAHYPHPKEVYDRCDALGIVVQTEGPCVNKLQSTMPEDYYTHLTTQYTDMVNQHYNHPCIFFWGLSNETTTDDKAFGKQKVEEYTALIKNLDSERMVGYVLAQSPGTSPSAYYNDPSNVDWFGCNIYVGWYDSPNSNTPVSQINTRLNNTINRVGKPMAYSEYGCGGTQRCHSDEFMNTTTRGNHERHDIEYMMWLHEGHIATIKQYPQLLFTSQWQLFDIAVANRNEGYTVCLDGENTSIDDELRRLNNKGLVERDHVTKKDTFYLYKAWWNPTPFVHICGKNYTKTVDRVIKCYTNQTTALTLKVNGTTVETKAATDNILTFTAHTFSAGDVVTVEGSSVSDTFTFDS